MKLWLTLLSVWAVFSGTLFSILVFVLDAPFLMSLVASCVLVLALLCFWGRDTDAEPLSMRESLWNTPEEEEDDADVSAR